MVQTPLSSYVNCQIYRLVWILVLCQNVSGQLRFVSVLLRNENVCVANISVLKDNQASDACKSEFNNTLNKTQTLEGKFYSDHTQLTNLTLNISSPCSVNNLSMCEAEERNAACPILKLCCLYISNVEFDRKEIYSRCPRVITRAYEPSACEGHARVTYHHSIYNTTEVQKVMEHNPDDFFWTDSYIISNITEKTNVDERTNTTAKSEHECIHFCLNYKDSPKVSFIEYASEKALCVCYAKNESGESMPVSNSVYEVKDRVSRGPYNELAGKKRCIAAIMSNSSVQYRVENCSYSYILLCGPIECSKRDSDYICDYSGSDPKAIPPSRTTAASTGTPGSTGSTVAPLPVEDRGLSKELIGILVAIVVVMMAVVFLIYKGAVYLRRKYMKKPMERGRPNSLSNRTYLMQNAEEYEDVYSAITENIELTHEIQRPLLPPRNNQGGTDTGDLIVFKTEYSTPSDNITTPTLVTDLDVYTDTYDNPLRKSRQNSRDDGHRVGAEGGVVLSDILQVNHTRIADGSDSCENKVAVPAGLNAIEIDVHAQNSRIKGDIDTHGGQTELGRKESTVDNISEQASNNYYKLEQSLDPSNTNCKQEMFQKDVSVPVRSVDGKTGDSDNSDYEDTSVIGGDLNHQLASNRGIPASGHGGRSDENNLLCTLSPVLLKQLNIKIVPDENEYACNYRNWPKSSSDENILVSDDQAINAVSQCKCGNPEHSPFSNNNDRTADEYDKLCYVRRVVSAGKPRNHYYHLVLKDGDTSDKSTSRRASV